ncbi:hypothetical protein HQ489_03990 [Candidatus Woesearchaeota archaeon]|nr:hypothetical protein [Candidatus Woesearchaeota archaeon]
MEHNHSLLKIKCRGAVNSKGKFPLTEKDAVSAVMLNGGHYLHVFCPYKGGNERELIDKGEKTLHACYAEGGKYSGIFCPYTKR